MKTRLTKKMLCALLSFVLVLTSIPFVVNAYNSDLASSLHSAIVSYEETMDGTIYKNMSAGYAAYVNAIKLYDRYYYGNDESVSEQDIQGAVSALEEETKDLKSNVWTPGEGINEVAPTQSDFAGGATEITNGSEFFNNIIYALPLPNSDNGENAGTASVGNATVNVYYSPTVVLYDGAEDPIIPVIASASGQNLYSLYPSMATSWRKDSTELSLIDYWIGTNRTNRTDFNWNYGSYYWNWGEQPLTQQRVAYKYSNGVKGVQSSSVSTQNYVLNGIKVLYKPGDYEFTKTLKTNWYVGAGSSPNSGEGTLTSDTEIYVINYNALKNAVERNSQKLDINVENTFANNGLAGIISAFDEATSFNPSSYDYTINASVRVTDVGLKLEEIVTNLDNAKADADPSAYQALRDAIDAQRARYEMYNTKDSEIETQKPETVFGAEQWNKFKTLYEKALSTMIEAATNTDDDYPASGDIFDKAQSTADELNTFVLEPITERVDTIILEYAIDNADFVIQNSSFFLLGDNPTDSNKKLEEIKNIVKEAKTAIWQAEENYPIDEYEPADTPENEDLVFEHLGYVADSIRNLSVNFSTVTKYTEDQSFNTLRNKAKDILDNHRSEYANSGELQIIYDNAVNYQSEDNNLHLLSEPGRQNYARNLYNGYIDIVVGLYDALNNLQSTFTTNIENGEIIDDGKLAPDFSIEMKVNNPTYYLDYFKRNTEQVLFRTSNEEADFKLGSTAIAIRTTVAGDKSRDILNGLDSLNLDAGQRNANQGGNSSTLVGNPGISTLSDENKNGAFSASLSASVAANDGTTAQYKITEIYATSGTSGTNGNSFRLATLADGTPINDMNRNLVDLVGTTDGNGYGTVNAFNNGSTYLLSNFLLHVPAVSNSVPTQTTYSFNDKYLGMVWHYKNQTNTAIREGYLSKSAQYGQSATVVDITPLITLTDQAEAKLAEYKNGKPVLYTTSSANDLAEALKNADSELDYWNLSAGQIVEKMTERYNAVNTALENLEVRADFENGYTDGATGETISSYNNAKYAVFKLLEDPTKHFTAESISALQDQLNSFTYLNYTTEQMENTGTKNGEQTTINGEIAQLLKIVSDFEKGEESAVLKEVSLEAYQETIDEVPTLNSDAYDKVKIQKAIDETSVGESTKINDQPVMSYTQEKVDRAASDIQTAINNSFYDYTVSVTDMDGVDYYIDTDKQLVKGNVEEASNAQNFHYGEPVEVTNPYGGECNWSGTVIAQTSKQDQTISYMATDSTYSFNVRGKTHLYIDEAQGEGNNVKIKLVDNAKSSKPLAFVTTSKSEAYDLKNAPAPVRMYYSIDSYTLVKDGELSTVFPANGTISADVLGSSDEIVLVVNYNLTKEEDEFDINVLNYNDGGRYYSERAKYNQSVTVNYPDPSTANRVYGFMDNYSGKMLAYGNTYTFYAAQDLDIKPIVSNTYGTLYKDQDGDVNYDVSVIRKPILSKNKKAQFIGSFAYSDLNEYECTLIGAGIVYNASGTPSEELTLGDVDGSKNIYNLSAPVSKIINTNQFAVSIGYSYFETPYPISYVAYVIYESTADDGSKTQHTVYSNVISDAVLTDE